MKYFLLFVAFAATYSSYGQDHEWLGTVFGEETYSTMLNTAPDKLEFYAYLDKHGHTVQDVAPKPVEQYPDALQVAPKSDQTPQLSLELILSDDFHSLMYDFNRDDNETTWYRIGDTSYLISLLPTKKVRNDFLEAQ